MATRQDRFHETVLRSLAVHDEQFIEAVLGIGPQNVAESGLDPRTHALVRLGALLAVDAGAPSYQWIVEAAFASGATTEEIAGTVIAVAPNRRRRPCRLCRTETRTGRRLRRRRGPGTTRRRQRERLMFRSRQHAAEQTRGERP